MGTDTTGQLLEGLRVLDLTDERGLLCGKLLADMGADVIVIEPPGGNPARNLGPFYKERPGPESSLFWWAYNTNKRSIVLDLQQPDGQELLRRLALQADVMIESFPPGTLAALGLSYETLHALNPRLILTSISAFGQDGPYRDFLGPDLVLMAMGGFLALTGDPQRPPLRVGFPQAYLHAAAEAAAATLIAYYERQHSGRGQHVDVAAQDCVIGTLMNAVPYPVLHGEDVSRAGLFNVSLGGKRRLIYPCQDGYLSFIALGGAMGAHAMQALTDWMAAEDMASPFMQAMDWPSWDVVATLQAGTAGQAQIDAVEGAVAAFFMTHTKQELYEGAIARRILLAPIADVRDIMSSQHLAFRGYFVTVEHEDCGISVRYPGAFAKLTATPLRLHRRAPYLGEHNREVYLETLGLSLAEYQTLLTLGVISPTPAAPAPQPLPRISVAAPATLPAEPSAPPPFAGLRVVDFTWYAAGPITSKYLADHGAEVIKIESMARPDLIRWAPPWRHATPDPDMSQFFAMYNTGKLGITLNLNKPEAQELARELVKTADLVCESFSPRAMRRWGLDYDALRRIKPDLVMMSSCQQGQNGPHAGFVGTGNLLAALCGFYQITGYEAETPLPIYGAYTDFIAPRLAVTAVIAALAHRRRTGQGQYIDLSQYEASLHFLAPLLLDYEVNGHLSTRRGNRDDQAAPHGTYRCKGDDRWCAIAVSTEKQWLAFCKVLGYPEWTGSTEFATRQRRLRHAARLDLEVERWTSQYDAHEVMHTLQAAGVPAGVVLRCSEFYHDPHLQHQGFFIELEHPAMGRTPYDSPQHRLSRTPPTLRPAPTLGQHNDYVFKDILGLTDAQVGRLMEAEVVY